jgi:ribosome hibernation promoting factor
VHIGRGIQIQAQGDADSPYPAFDTAAEHLAKRLRRYKRRLRDHHQKTDAAHAPMPARQYVLAAQAESDEAEIDGAEIDGAEAEVGAADGDAAPVIVAEMTTEISSLTVSEAVMHMDLGELPALMFRNDSHGGLNMIYRRPDGNIGWIDPRGNLGQ